MQHMMEGAELDRKLERMAVNHEMTKDELVADILRNAMMTGKEYEAFIEEGLKDLREGAAVGAR